MLKPGQEIVVQVVKDPLKTKGARLSMDLTIAGRYMVYAPYGEGVGVSRRLDDKERERLRKEAAKLDLKGARRDHPHRRPGRQARRLRARAAVPVQARRGAREARRGDDRRRRSSSRRPTSRSASCATSSPRTSSARSSTTPSSTTGWSRSSRAPRPSSSTTSSCGRSEPPLFEAFGVEQVLDSTLSRRVDLPSGGYLMIDYAEALTVIDVNSGSFIGRGKGARLEDTITKTNLEAADEVVRQLRLRDIGGIIVIDFIDMARARNRDAVLKTLRKALDEDRTKTFVVEISPLGLVEMTRQNVTEGVREIMTRPCPTCHGEGVIKSEETIAIEFERRMRELAKRDRRRGVPDPDEPARQRRVHRQRARACCTRSRRRPASGSTSRAPRACRSTTSRCCCEGDREEVLERAVPFRVGEEVLRRDRRAAHVQRRRRGRQDRRLHHLGPRRRPLVGEKHLVRIEEVGRTAAIALLIDVPGAASAGGGADGRTTTTMT